MTDFVVVPRNDRSEFRIGFDEKDPTCIHIRLFRRNGRRIMEPTPMAFSVPKERLEAFIAGAERARLLLQGGDGM